MIGTILNVAGILAGSIVGLSRSKVLPLATESYLRLALAAFTLFYGLRLGWLSFSGSVFQLGKELLILLLALMLGKFVGRLLHLQKLSNHLGHLAQQRMAEGKSQSEPPTSAAFKTSTVLFCLAPLGVLGALADGLAQYFYPLAVKAVMDGLASLGLVLMLGWGVILSAIPVLAVQGTISLLSSRMLLPFLAAQGLLDSVNAVTGVLLMSVALVMLGIKRIELTDYLPSLAVAPLLTWALR